MFPPESTATARLAETLPLTSAASATAPAPSTTVFSRSSRCTITRAISASVTVTTSSTSSRIRPKVISPGRFTAIPSAIVWVCGTGVIAPCSIELTYGAQPAASTPITRISGR